MRCWLTLLSFLFSVVPLFAQTPTLQPGIWDNSVNQSGSGIPDFFQCNCIKVPVLYPVASNKYVLYMQWGDTTQTITVTDSTSDTPSVDIGPLNTGNGDELEIVSIPIQAGTTSIKVQWSGTIPAHTTVRAFPYSNLGTKRTSCSNLNQTGASTTCSAAMASIATTDLVFFGVIQESAVLTTAWTAGTGFTLLSADRMNVQDSAAIEAGTGLSGSVNPILTIAPSTAHWSVASVAYQGTSAGGAPSCTLCVLADYSMADDGGVGRVPPFAIQTSCPTGTDGRGLNWIGQSASDATGVSGGGSGAWTSIQASTANGASGTLHQWYKIGSSNLQEALTISGTTNPSVGSQVNIICYKGSKQSSPIGATATINSGSNASALQYNSVSITPTQTGSIIQAVHGVASNNTDPPSDTPGFYGPPNENNEFMWFLTPSTSAIQFKVTSNVGGNSNWAAQAAEILAAPAASNTFGQVFVIRP